jgi:hypothetical protein
MSYAKSAFAAATALYQFYVSTGWNFSLFGELAFCHLARVSILSLIQLLGRESSKFILDCLLPVDHLAVDQSEFSGR